MNFKRNRTLFLILFMANVCLFFGAAIKFFNIIWLNLEDENKNNDKENYGEMDAQIEQCITGFGKIKTR